MHSQPAVARCNSTLSQVRHGLGAAPVPAVLSDYGEFSAVCQDQLLHSAILILGFRVAEPVPSDQDDSTVVPGQIQMKVLNTSYPQGATLYERLHKDGIEERLQVMAMTELIDEAVKCGVSSEEIRQFKEREIDEETFIGIIASKTRDEKLYSRPDAGLASSGGRGIQFDYLKRPEPELASSDEEGFLIGGSSWWAFRVPLWCTCCNQMLYGCKRCCRCICNLQWCYRLPLWLQRVLCCSGVLLLAGVCAAIVFVWQGGNGVIDCATADGERAPDEDSCGGGSL